MKLNATVFNLLFLIFFIINKNYFYIFRCNFFFRCNLLQGKYQKKNFFLISVIFLPYNL
jgi:hypothetical protein